MASFLFMDNMDWGGNMLKNLNKKLPNKNKTNSTVFHNMGHIGIQSTYHNVRVNVTLWKLLTDRQDLLKNIGKRSCHLE